MGQRDGSPSCDLAVLTFLQYDINKCVIMLKPFVAESVSEETELVFDQNGKTEALAMRNHKS